MKKYLIFTIITLLSGIWLLTSNVHAQGAENITKRRPDHSPLGAEIQEIKQERQQIRNQVAENHANRLEKRFTAYAARFDNITSRFQKRLGTLNTAGKDVTNIQTKLEAVKIKLVEAKEKGVEAVAAFRAIDPTKFSEMKAERLAARDLAVTARKLFIETHTLLKDALHTLKTISKPALPAAEEAL
ncbi:MAG: hypothetical protein ABII21_02600 [bacterium]